MTFKLSKNSLAKLDGVHPDLASVVKLAITYTTADFTVFSGVRTAHEQAALVKKGASQTTDSKHLKQSSTGFGHAVDLVPHVDGRAQWLWPECYEIATAMRKAANELGVAVRWGGCWQPLNLIDDPKVAVERYGAERRKLGKKAFTDGVHYELMK